MRGLFGLKRDGRKRCLEANERSTAMEGRVYYMIPEMRESHTFSMNFVDSNTI
jgi:hypothetical protein